MKNKKLKSQSAKNKNLKSHAEQGVQPSDNQGQFSCSSLFMPNLLDLLFTSYPHIRTILSETATFYVTSHIAFFWLQLAVTSLISVEDQPDPDWIDEVPSDHVAYMVKLMADQHPFCKSMWPNGVSTEPFIKKPKVVNRQRNNKQYTPLKKLLKPQLNRKKSGSKRKQMRINNYFTRSQHTSCTIEELHQMVNVLTEKYNILDSEASPQEDIQDDEPNCNSPIISQYEAQQHNPPVHNSPVHKSLFQNSPVHSHSTSSHSYDGTDTILISTTQAQSPHHTPKTSEHTSPTTPTHSLNIQLPSHTPPALKPSTSTPFKHITPKSPMISTASYIYHARDHPDSPPPFPPPAL
ncbi:hypothetical protein Bca4012_063238 [Brassica carinata]